MKYILKKFSLFFLAAVLFATAASQNSALAIDAEQRRIIDSGSLFYNVEETPVCPGGRVVPISTVATSVSSNIPETHRSILMQAASAHSVSPNLLAALYLTEQGNNWKPLEGPYASSPVGASGPFQFMPGTWGQYKQDGNGDGVQDIQSFADAAAAAAKMASANGVTANTPLGDLNSPFQPGTIIYFSMAYNWGGGNVGRQPATAPLSNAPAETENYVRNIHSLLTTNFTKSGHPRYNDPAAAGGGTSTGATGQPATGGGCANAQGGAGTGDGTLPTSPPTVTCDGKKVVEVTASSDLKGLVSEAGNDEACFRLANGNYSFGNIRPRSYQTFLGASAGGVIVNGNGFENAFHGTALGVSISNFTLTGFNGTGGTKLQEQSPIRGSDALWSDSKANGWIIENMAIHGNAAAGVFMGDNFTVRNSVIYNNGVTGIGGDSFIGGRIEGNEVYNNGFNAATGADQNGAGIKVTQVKGTGTRLLITGNKKIHDNDIGIWCDVDCDGVTIENNEVYNHKTTGIFYEISRNGVIRNNVVTNSSTWVNWNGAFNNGSISAGESQNVTIEGNTVNGGASAITIRGTLRPAAGESYLINSNPNRNTTTSNITVRNNIINGSGSIGASHETAATSKIDYSSISFTGNTYSNPGGMRFWWNRSDMDYNGWLAAGRDVAGSGTPRTIL